jgi:hypothetical protein
LINRYLSVTRKYHWRAFVRKERTGTLPRNEGGSDNSLLALQ